GASTRAGPGSTTSSARASAWFRFTFVTRARTVSPGSPRRTKTTNPFRRATPFPPYASESILSSSSSSLRTGAATPPRLAVVLVVQVAERRLDPLAGAAHHLVHRGTEHRGGEVLEVRLRLPHVEDQHPVVGRRRIVGDEALRQALAGEAHLLVDRVVHVCAGRNLGRHHDRHYAPFSGVE